MPPLIRSIAAPATPRRSRPWHPLRVLPLVVACLTLASLLPIPSFGQEEPTTNLQPRWEAGREATFDFWSHRELGITMRFGDQTQQAQNSMETEGRMLWRVERVHPGGGATCTMTLQWMTLVITGDEGQVQRQDSRQSQGDHPLLQNVLQALAGAPLTVEIAPDGTVTSLTGVDAMRRRAQEPELVPDELNFIESAFELIALPGAPAEARPGQSWRQSLRWSHELGHMQHDAGFELLSVREIEGIPIAEVRVTSRPRLEVDRQKLPPAPGDAPIDVQQIEASYDARILYDLSRHEPVGRHQVETELLRTTIPLPQGRLERETRQQLRSQILRVAETAATP